MSAPPKTVTLAILYSTDGDEPAFLMQLRDDLPRILYPGVWGLFGGHLEPNEAPLPGLRRELLEEIHHCPDALILFRTEVYEARRRHFFHAPLRVPLKDLTLGEGMDLDLVPLSHVQHGYHHSRSIDDLRPLGDPHQAVLLDFARTKGWLTNLF